MKILFGVQTEGNGHITQAIAVKQYLQSKGLPFVGIQASAYTRIISDFIYNGALKASREQAELYGEPEWCKGTGLRHSHHIAIAPTVSNAHVSGGVSPSIEPIPANVYNLKTAKGVFIKRNKILEELLEKKGYNIDSVWDQILKDQGSVINVPSYILTDEEKYFFSKNGALGFIVFARNIQDKAQLKSLTDSLREVMEGEVLILVDQEGGRVARMKEPHWKKYPAGQYFADLYQTNQEQAREALFKIW